MMPTSRGTRFRNSKRGKGFSWRIGVSSGAVSI